MRELSPYRVTALVFAIPFVVLIATGCGSDSNLESVTESSPEIGERAVSEPVGGTKTRAATGAHASISSIEAPEDLRPRFTIKPADLPLRAHGLFANDSFARNLPRGPRPVIPKAHAVKLVPSSAGFTPQWPKSQAVALLLPSSAEHGFRLEDAVSKLALRATLVGSRDVQATLQDGLAVYERAAPAGGRITHRVTPLGTEDYVEIEERPERPELVYTLDLSSTVSGLRLVGNVLELVDASGAPRLRVTAPMVVDATGTTSPATLSVEDCKVDTDPSPPWNRTPVSPGASNCSLRVSWKDSVVYPIIVDPSWTNTTSLGTPRADARAVTLAQGRVLVVGGVSSDWSTCLASSELFDPATQTWAAVGDMSVGRCAHSLVKRANGQALATGGYDSSYTDLGSTETFDAATGRWVAGPSLRSPRSYHESTLLTNGEVLVAGGSQLPSERLNSRGSSWQSAAALPASFFGHTLTSLPGAKAVVVGGESVLTYTASLNIWSPVTTAPKVARYEHQTTVLKDGRLLITQGGTPSADLYDAVSNAWTKLGGMSTPRSSHTATVMPDGRVLIVGGYSSSLSIDVNTETFNPTWGTFAPAPELSAGRVGHIAASLPNGSILIAGGFDLDTYSVTGGTSQLASQALGSVITEYKGTATIDSSVTSSTQTELWAAVARPATLSAGKKYPLLVFLHGNHGTCGTGTNPREDWSCEYTDSGTCPSGFVVSPSHRGYDYVASELAAHDYIVVSINANRGITCGSGEDGDFGFNLARGRLILRHLQQLSEWHRGVTATPGSLGFDLKGTLDFSQVGIMGHSRGGEGARAAYEQLRDLGSPWPARIVEPVAIRAIFEIGPVDGQTSRVLNADGTRWNVLLPLCDGDVSSLEGVRPFDRMMGFTLPNSGGPKSTYVAWGTNHNFFNSEWQVSDSSGCGDHEALFPSSPGSIPQRQIGLRSMFDFFRANVGPRRADNLSDLFNPELFVPFESRVDRGYSPGEGVADHLKLEEFTRAAGTSYFNVRNTHSRVTVTHEVPSAHDSSLKAALVKWTSNSSSTYFQVNFANQGGGIDLSRYDLLDIRVGRSNDNLNRTDLAYVDVQLINANNSVTGAVALGDYVGGLVKASGPGWEGGHVMLPTARIPLTSFSGAQLGRIRGVRFTPRSTPTGAMYLANIRATYSTYVGDTASPRGATPQVVSVAQRTTAPTQTIVSGNSVDSITTTPDGNSVEVALSSSTPFRVRDQLLALEVGGQVRSRFSRHPSGNVKKVVFRMPKTDFEALPANEAVRVRYGSGPGPAWDFGRMDKSRAQ
jgi:hypothetical protein